MRKQTNLVCVPANFISTGRRVDKTNLDVTAWVKLYRSRGRDERSFILAMKTHGSRDISQTGFHKEEQAFVSLM